MSQKSGGLKGILNVVWILFLGGWAISRLFGGDGEQQSAVAGKVTVFFEEDEHATLAASIAKNLATDPIHGDQTSAYSLDLTELEGGYQLQAALKPNVQYAPAGFQLMARVLTDECKQPIQFEIVDDDGDLVDVVGPGPSLGKRLQRGPDSLYYAGDLDEKAATEILDKLEATGYLKGGNDVLQAEKTSNKLAIRFASGTPLALDTAEQLRGNQLKNLRAFKEQFADVDLRVECTNEVFRAFPNMGWDVVTTDGVSVAFDESITQQTAKAIADRAIKPGTGMRLIQITSSDDGIECVTDFPEASLEMVGFWGAEILTELPAEIEKITMIGRGDSGDTTKRTIKTRAGRCIKDKDNRLFVAADCDEEMTESIVRTFRELEIFEDDGGAITRLAADDERYILQVLMPENYVANVSAEELAEVGAAFRANAFADHDFRIELARFDFEPFEGASWESPVGTE